VNIGKSEKDKSAESLLRCRQITTEILNFGVSQEDIMQVIYLLSLELENRQALEEISNVVSNYKKDPFADQKQHKLLEI
jgi:hypothetical protein